MQKLLSLLTLVLITGCTTGSALVTGTQRPPIDISEVKIYREAPGSDFEHIGIVKSKAEEVFLEQEAVDRALEELKKQAAKIGANGIIIRQVGEDKEGYVSYVPNAYGGGFFSSGTTDYQTLQADAIFVAK